MAPTSVRDLVALVDLSGDALALLSVFGVLVTLAALIKGICFALEMVRGEGNGICPRGSLGAPDDPETRGGEAGAGERKPRQAREKMESSPKDRNDGGLC